MIYVIGICRGVGYKPIGFRLLHIDIMKIIDTKIATVHKALDDGYTKIENVWISRGKDKQEDLKVYRDLKLDGNVNMYADIWNGSVEDYRALVILWKDSDGRYVCADPRGFLHGFTKDQLVRRVRSKEFRLANYRLSNDDRFLGRTPIKIIDKHKEIYASRRIEKYRSKCEILSLKPLGLTELKGELSIISSDVNIKDAVIPDLVTRIEDKSFLR